MALMRGSGDTLGGPGEACGSSKAWSAGASRQRWRAWALEEDPPVRRRRGAGLSCWGWEAWRGAGQARWAHGVRDLRLGAEGSTVVEQLSWWSSSGGA